MTAAHRASPYKQERINTLGSLLFDKLNASGAADLSELEVKDVQRTSKFIHTDNQRIKEFKPVIQSKESSKLRDLR